MAPSSVSAAANAPIPFKQEAALGSTALGGGAALVLLVSLLAIGVVLYLRRRLNLAPALAGTPRLLRVLERQPLGPRAVLLVVEFEGERLLLAHTEHGVTRLAQGKEAA
jgi:flagellar biogenesis protein FliO